MVEMVRPTKSPPPAPTATRASKADWRLVVRDGFSALFDLVGGASFCCETTRSTLALACLTPSRAPDTLTDTQTGLTCTRFGRETTTEMARPIPTFTPSS